MTERDLDNDIDFDFFEEEPPTQEEAPRSERLIRRPRGPRGPRRPPRGPANLTPLLRLVGLIAFAILVIVLLVFWIQSCQESSKTKTYKSYLTKVSQVTSSSQQIGRQLSQALLTAGVKQAALQRQISGFARQEQLDVDRARSLTPPGTLRDEQQALVQALQFRVSGLTGLADALQTTARTKDLNRAGAVVASQMQRLLASDVLYDDLFKAPTAAELQRQGVTGTNDNGGPLVPSSTFLQNSELVTANAMASVLQKFRGGRAAPTSGGLHGTNIVSTKVLPSGTELSTSQTNTITVTADMAFQVTIEDSGDSNEVQIPVKLTIEQSRGGNITKTAVIPFIAKGEQQQVTFRHIPLPNFASQATLKIEVTPVPGEKNTSNNSSDYPVIFSA